jgi:hypothetical protein
VIVGVAVHPPEWLVTAVHLADLSVLCYELLVNSFFALLLAAPQLFAHWRFGSEDVLARSPTSSAVPRVSILVPAHNEAVTIVDSPRSLLTLQSPYYEVVAGQRRLTDETMARPMAAHDRPTPRRTAPAPRWYCRRRPRRRTIVRATAAARWPKVVPRKSICIFVLIYF